MVGICDIHCHTLYGVDDGSKYPEQSLCMMDIAYSEGIRTIILTPHHNRRFGDTDISALTGRYEALCQETKGRYPDMRILLGNEIYYTENSARELAGGRCLTMAGGSYVLIEFAVYVDFAIINHAVTELVQYGYRPILAHIERYDCLLKHPERVDTIVEMGAYMQVNAASIMGKNGKTARKMTRKLLKKGLVHFIATDAHRDNHRAPHIQACAKYIERKFGNDYADIIFRDNPQCIINNEYIEETLWEQMKLK